MGGIVATSLLPSDQISAIITMATPFAMPPARFEASVDAVYDMVHDRLAHDTTPILSLCGGATDKMIPSESCIIPTTTAQSGWRQTIFTSALEGSWTGVGHEVIVWCHQVRWRIARAALESAPLKSTAEVVKVLDRWLRGGQTLPNNYEETSAATSDKFERSTIVQGNKLTLVKPQASGSYRLKVHQTGRKQSLTVLLSQGTIGSIGPHRPIPLRVSLSQCNQGSCSPLPPATLRMLPSPIPGKPFPVPGEGTDESEGVVLFEADVPPKGVDDVVVKVEDADGRGWLVASIVEETAVSSDGSIFGERLSSMSRLLSYGVVHQRPPPLESSSHWHSPVLLPSNWTSYFLSSYPMFLSPTACIQLELLPRHALVRTLTLNSHVVAYTLVRNALPSPSHAPIKSGRDTLLPLAKP